MHRRIIDWNKNDDIDTPGTIESIIFTSTKKLIELRKRIAVIADKKNLTWLRPHNIHVAGFLRAWGGDRVYCLFNFSKRKQSFTWYAFKENGMKPIRLYDHWSKQYFDVGVDNEYFVLPPYSFFILEPK
jgi:amylosucrase